jgi:N-acetyl-D-muramate 6-phosphate phosphatase
MTILFDLDGTLVDTLLDFIAIIHQIRKEQNLDPLPESANANIRIAVSHGLDRLLEVSFGIQKDHPKVLFWRKLMLDAYQENLGLYATVFPGMEKVLDTLDQRGIRWGIVTNKEAIQTEPLLKKLELSHRAACIVSGDTTPYTKPHPEPLLHACRTIGVSPQDCLYIGDHERDIIAGKAAGMRTIGALFGYIEDIESAKNWGADHYIYHPEEILSWYEQWEK